MHPCSHEEEGMTSSSPQQHDVSQAQLLELVRIVLTIRQFETTVRALVESNEIAGVTHEYIGQEAIAAGICLALRKDDYLVSTHRGHGHSIAKGADVTRMYAELLGRDTGLNRGRGGSMHVASVADGVLGANGIVAGGVPFALGAAWSARAKGADSIAVAFFGDGGANEGIIYECLNLASIWRLPVIFACENNQYAVSLRAQDAIAGSLVARARAFGMSAHECDGMNPMAVLQLAQQVVPEVRRGNPCFIELETYRFVGHHTAEASSGMRYRTDEEVAEWKRRDPVDQLADAVGLDAIAEMSARIRSDLAHHLALARLGRAPAPGSALQFMYATPLKVVP